MVVEIEYYKGDVLLYGKDISKQELKKQLIEIENTYEFEVAEEIKRSVINEKNT